MNKLYSLTLYYILTLDYVNANKGHSFVFKFLTSNMTPSCSTIKSLEKIY